MGTQIGSCPLQKSLSGKTTHGGLTIGRFLRGGIAFFMGVTLMLSPVQARAWSGDYLEAVKSFVQSVHLEDVSDEDMLEAAIKGMLSAIDPYSEFLNREEMDAYQTNLTGRFSGIGAVLEPDADGTGIHVNTVFADSPAEKADVREGDVILRVDGQSMAGKTAAEAAVLIRGEANTKVTLDIRRGTQVITRVVTRGQIALTPVSYRIQEDVGIVRITQFSRGMSAELELALKSLREAGIHKLMLDLRDNPGGYVDEAVSAARLLIPAGPIVTVDYRSERIDDETYEAGGADPGWILAVLVNEDTASAAEILAGAIQDAENGVLIGQKTYGKGVVQHLFTLLTPEAYEKYGDAHADAYVTEMEWANYYGVQIKPDEAMGLMKITTGRYLTRNGRALDQEGLLPDIATEVVMPVQGYEPTLVAPIPVSETLVVGAYGSAVQQAEIILSMLTLFSEVPDKTYDSETETAIRAWQTRMGLPKTGALDPQTAASLNRKLDSLRQTNPSYAEAWKILRLF